MNTVRGIYRGPQQAITLEGQDYTLTPGAVVELPRCEYVDRLVACQLLLVGDYQMIAAPVIAPVIAPEPPVAPIASTTDEATGAEEPRPAPAKPPKAAEKKEVK